jgi:hypothetical protein
VKYDEKAVDLKRGEREGEVCLGREDKKHFEQYIIIRIDDNYNLTGGVS